MYISWTIKINRQQPKLIVWALPINRQSPQTVSGTIPIRRQSPKSISDTTFCWNRNCPGYDYGRAAAKRPRRRANMVTTTPEAVPALTWSNDFYSRTNHISDYTNSTCDEVGISGYKGNTFNYFYTSTNCKATSGDISSRNISNLSASTLPSDTINCSWDTSSAWTTKSVYPTHNYQTPACTISPPSNRRPHPITGRPG